MLLGLSKMQFALLFFAQLSLYGSQAKFVYVTVTNGTLLGSVQDGIAKFSGIPYASPPIGELRFEPPKPAKAWNGTLNVSNDQKIACSQRMYFGRKFSTTENCLFLHVLTPNISGHLPVLVWIHGGGFVIGHSTEYPLDGLAKNLAKRDVVVVAINYRLNVFGFFSSYTDEFPGNMGILDQIQALKWVQTEIGNFGGNSNQVTIMGESAGAISVSLLTYSPLARGLFRQAIMESGNVYAAGALNGLNGRYAETSMRLAIALNCSTVDNWINSKNFEAIVSCLRQKSTDQLINAANGVKNFLLRN